ncbi:MAG: hypothetical protein V7700_17210 [Halioglobus sp.]
MTEAAKLLWGSLDAHRYYLYVGASAFVFSAEQVFALLGEWIEKGGVAHGAKEQEALYVGSSSGINRAGGFYSVSRSLLHCPQRI